MARRRVGRCHTRIEVEDLEVILRVSFVVLLARCLAHLRSAGEKHPGPRAVSAGSERALATGHLPMPVELSRVLAEVPDVAGAILGVPVAGDLAALTVPQDDVMDDGNAHAQDR